MTKYIWLFLLAMVSLLPHPHASATSFKGYYAPEVLVSPMRDDMTYTPVGLGDIKKQAGSYVDPRSGKKGFNEGVDLKAKLNDKFYCLLDGVVTRVGWRSNQLGVSVEIYHPYPSIRTIYSNLNAYSVMPGAHVQRGRVIGYAGASGGTGKNVCLHFTVVNEQGEYIEPLA